MSSHTRIGQSGARDRTTQRRRLTDAELELLLTGVVPPGRDDLAAIAEALGELRRRAHGSQAPRMGLALLAEVWSSREDALSPRALARRGAVWASAAVLIAVALLGVGASHNALPAGLQDVVSASAAQIGIDLPTAEERTPGSRTSGGTGVRGEDDGPEGGPTQGPGDAQEHVPGSPADPVSPPDLRATGNEAPATPGPPEDAERPSDAGAGGPVTDPSSGAPDAGDAPPPDDPPDPAAPDLDAETPSGPDESGGPGTPAARGEASGDAGSRFERTPAGSQASQGSQPDELDESGSHATGSSDGAEEPGHDREQRPG